MLNFTQWNLQTKQSFVYFPAATNNHCQYILGMDMNEQSPWEGGLHMWQIIQKKMLSVYYRYIFRLQ